MDTNPPFDHRWPTHGKQLFKGINMLWVKAFHLIGMVSWFAGLFYLPRLLVYHAQSEDTISIERFKIMERRLYNGIMHPAALITIIFGTWLMSYNFSGYLQMGWMHTKLLFIFILIGYHVYCGKLLKDFKSDKNKYSSNFFRWFNEIPTVILFVIIILVVVKP